MHHVPFVSFRQEYIVFQRVQYSALCRYYVLKGPYIEVIEFIQIPFFFFFDGGIKRRRFSGEV
jgi:hypothetical protein